MGLVSWRAPQSTQTPMAALSKLRHWISDDRQAIGKSGISTFMTASLLTM